MKLIEGNIFNTSAEIIVHQVNCFGVMGSGIAKQVRDIYPEVYTNYKQLCELNRNNARALMGFTYICRTRTGRYVANLFGQFDFGTNKYKIYTNYDALRSCFKNLNTFVKSHNNRMKVAIPYNIGCCRGRGDWNVVLRIIADELNDIDVEIWKLNE